jgi:hypothetical protein
MSGQLGGGFTNDPGDVDEMRKLLASLAAQDPNWHQTLANEWLEKLSPRERTTVSEALMILAKLKEQN